VTGANKKARAGPSWSRKNNRRVTRIALTRKIQSACSASNESNVKIVKGIAASVANDGIDPVLNLLLLFGHADVVTLTNSRPQPL
jgi:hypothetical protein